MRQFPAHGLFNNSLIKNLKLSVGPLALEKSGWLITGHHPYWEVSLLFQNFKAPSDCSLPVSGALLVLESMSVIHKSCNSVFITWAVTGEALQKALTAGTCFSHKTVQMILLILLRGVRVTGRLLTLPVNQDYHNISICKKHRNKLSNKK